MRAKSYFNGSVEVRKSNLNSKPSSHQGKPDVLPFLNHLDKCTQILRQDRLWIRNQLKAGNQDLINIFRTIKKPLNLQHLQIKLRKHITSVKSKAKMQQLMKFKENMSMGEDKFKYEKPQNNNKSYSKECPSYKLSYEKYKAPATQSVDKFSKKVNADKGHYKPNKTSYTYQNFQHQQNNLNHENSLQEQKTFLNYEMPMQQISERQSENVTSTRHRAFHEDNFGQRVISQQTKKQDKPFSYARWQKPENQNKGNFLNNIQNFVDKKFEIPVHQNEEEEDQFQNSNEQQQEQYEQEQNYDEEVEEPVIRRHDNFLLSLNKDYENKFKKNHEQASKKYMEVEQIKNQNFILDNNEYSASICQNDSGPTIKMEYNFEKAYEPKQPSLPLSRYTHSKTPSNNIPQEDSSFALSSHNRSKDEEIFTSPQLLLECKKFINKVKSNTNTDEKSFPPVYEGTSYLNNNFQNNFVKNEEIIKPLELQERIEVQKKSYPIQSKSSYSYTQNYLNNDILGSTQNSNFIKNGLESKKDQLKEFDYSFPVVVEEKRTFTDLLEKKKEEYIPQIQQKYSNNYEYFHTFAASNQKEKESYSMKKQQKVQKLQQNISSPEQILDEIMKLGGQNYIHQNDLERVLTIKYPSLRQQVISQFQGMDQINYASLGKILELILENGKNRTKSSQVHTLCCLLDIQKNGYIFEDNVADFLQQLENADAQNFNEVSEALWSLFDQGALLTEEGQKVIDYWGFYCMKQLDAFKELQELLKEYEFEIDNSVDENQN